MADIATQNQPFVALVGSVIPFQANLSHFFAVFDSLVAITTHPGASNSRSGRFRVNDNNNRRTNRLLYPLLRMRARGNNIMLSLKKARFSFRTYNVSPESDFNLQLVVQYRHVYIYIDLLHYQILLNSQPSFPAIWYGICISLVYQTLSISIAS